MKKFISILSWLSFVTIALTISLLSLYIGAVTCNYLSDTFGIYGLFLVPVMFAVSTAFCCLIILGLRKFGEPNY